MPLLRVSVTCNLESTGDKMQCCSITLPFALVLPISIQRRDFIFPVTRKLISWDIPEYVASFVNIQSARSTSVLLISVDEVWMVKRRVESVVLPFPNKTPIVTYCPSLSVIKRKSTPDIDIFIRWTWVIIDIEPETSVEFPEIDGYPPRAYRSLAYTGVIVTVNLGENLSVSSNSNTPFA